MCTKVELQISSFKGILNTIYKLPKPKLNGYIKKNRNSLTSPHLQKND